MAAESVATATTVDPTNALPFVERGERLLLGPDGKPAAVLVSMDTLAELERLRELAEELEDAAAIDAAYAQMTAAGQQPVPLEELLAKHGL